MSTKNFLLGVFSLVVLSFLVPTFSVHATTYPIDVPCALQQGSGYTTTNCTGHITINNNTPLQPGQTVNVEWWIDDSGYNGIVGAPSTIEFNGQEGFYNSTCHNNCKRAWTSFQAPSDNGTYSVSVFYQWTWAGTYSYTTPVSYEVCDSGDCGSGGGSGGNSNYNYPIIDITADSTNIISGQDTDIYWEATYASSCNVTESGGYTVGSGTNGTYNTGSLYSDTTYFLSCQGSLASIPQVNRFADLINSIKEKIWPFAPKINASNNIPTNEPPVVSDWVTIHVTEPQLSVQLTSDKDLVRSGDTGTLGTVKLKSIISGLPSGTSCLLNNLTKNSTLHTFTSDTPVSGQQIPDSYLSSTNNYALDCTDVNNTSTEVTVLGQSGTLDGAATCTIPSGGNKCSGFVITHTIVNKDPNTSTTLKNTNGVQVGVPSNTSPGTFSVDVNYGAQTFTSYNAVDGENNGPSVANSLASHTVTANCATGTAWNGTVCAPLTTIDLSASNTTPNTATVNVAKTFYSLITNQGTASTGRTFPNIFQTATGFDDPTLQLGPINLNTYAANPNPMATLVSNGSSQASRSFTFTTPGVIYMRACADKNTSMVGVVTETYENNNCSPNWIPVTVSGGADLIAGTTSPTSALAGVATTYSSTITNQGSIATGAPFYNLFQTATGFDDPTLQLGPINLTDYVTTSQMTALNPGQSNTASRLITLSTGDYFMRACADKSSATNAGAISEPGAEGNNCSAWVPLSIPPQLQPDLIAAAPTPTVAVVNVATTFRSLITNQGPVGTGRSFGNLFQVTTNPISGPITDYPTILSMSALAGNGGSSTAASPAITLASTGTYYMRACADKTSAGSVGVVAESSEINNCSSWTPITVVPTGLADLTAGGITPVSVMVDVSTTFQATIANIGNASTGIGFYNLIQTSTTATGTNPQDLMKISTTTLPAQSFRTISFIHTPKAAGTFYARVCADKSSQTDAGVISESSEGNNCGPWTRIDVLGNDKPDLVASAPTPTVVVINMANTFSSTIRNQGTVSTGTKVNNLFQVSTSSTGASDVTDYPADVNVPALDGGESGTTISPSITFTKEIPYYMRACADKTSAGDVGGIPESNEGNNCSAWTLITVQPEGMKIHGGWSNPVCGACSVSCGGGTQSCTRTCTNPVPQNGGDPCSGPAAYDQTCNPQACGGGGGTGELMVTLTASPTQIFKGRSSTLTWNSTADSCASEDFATGDKPTGSVLVNPTITTTYKITCRNSVAEDSATATIKVINPIIQEN